MYNFTIPREKFDENNPDKQIIRHLISKHISMVDRLKKNMAYYQGKHKILEESNRDNRLVCNHAKDISDTASSYFIGNPVSYKSESDITALTDKRQRGENSMSDIGGLDTVEETTEEKVVEMTEKKERKPFHYWTVNGRDYRLKLKASTINKLENKYRQNILNMLDDIPPLSVMLTIIQAAMEPWEHGLSYTKVQNLYDYWADEEGGNQTDLYSKIIIPTLAVSGFFTQEQADVLVEEMQNV